MNSDALTTELRMSPPSVRLTDEGHVKMEMTTRSMKIRTRERGNIQLGIEVGELSFFSFLFLKLMRLRIDR